jgi:hypothetical protein
MSLDMAVSAKHFKHVGTPHSELVHHGQCCQLAQRWLHDMHRSMSFHRSENQELHAPLWLRHKFKWGPVQWPLSWCEAVRKKQIDCGVFAAFAREILSNQDVDVFPAQIMLAQPKTYVHQWNLKWANVFQHIQWIGEDHVYHEVCAVAKKGQPNLRIFDPTEGIWIESNFTHGINGVVGVNVISQTIMQWGSHPVGQGKWVLA